MVTTISLDNIHPSSISYRNNKKKEAKKQNKNVFSLVMRTLRSYSFHSFPVYQRAV